MIQRRNDSPTVTGSAGTAGGAGGNGTAYTLNLSVTRYAGGGAGFGGGLGRQSLASGATGNQSNNATYDGGTGAGGLLVVWVRRNIVNASGNTAFESRGSQGGGAVPSGSELSAGGGSSGSGSVNVFYEYAVTNLTTTNLDVSGIAAKTSTATGGTGGAGSKNLELLNTSKPRLTLFLVGTSYKKYVPSSATAGTWTTVGSTSDWNATKETMFQTHGMFDEDIKLYVTKAILADSGAYGANPSNITVRTYVPS